MIRFNALLLLVFFALLGTGTQAAPAVNDYGALPTTSRMTLSPDGKVLAFRKVEAGKDVLVVYSLEQGKTVRVLDISSVNPEHIYFTSDKQLILRVGKHQRLYGYDEETMQVSVAFVMDVEKGGLEQLLRPGDKIYGAQSNIGNLIGVSGDRRHVYMPAYVDAKDDTRADAATTYEGVFNYTVMEVDLQSPNNPSRLYKGDKDAIDYFMGPKGEILVQERYGEHSNRHEILVKEGANWRSIYDKKLELREISPVGLTPDYKNLVILAYGEGSDRQQYLTMSLADGKVSDPGFSREHADVDDVVSDNNRIVHGVQYSGFLPEYKLFDDKRNQLLQYILKKFPENSVFPVSWSDDWSRVLVRVEGSGYPIEYYLFDQKLEPKFLGAAYANIKAQDVHPVAKLSVKARDGLVIPTLLTIPKTAVENMKNLPAVMLPHGGPRAYDQIGFDWLAQALANEGYMVVQPQFRGSAGFGWEHYAAGRGEWGGKMQDDITDTLDFLVAKGYVNKDKVCIAGASYGGYAALIGGALTPGKYRCVASINGVSNPLDMVKEDRAKFGRYSSVVAYWGKHITKDGLKAEALQAVSPYHLAKNFTAPVLLIHGVNDELVSRKQSEDMAASLKAADKKVELVKLEGESHYLETNAGRLQTLRALTDFLNKNLK